ncbi:MULTISPECIES: AAA domain-containing protein [Pseudofrankia]|uniref:AAA domain-containing protein n=1 Tax=Pseudofrankia TaxID=2994363 RepID=UPI000487586E|nr:MULTISPECIES: AAA domain-containing protein [Pseudofrankia]OHV31556.1 hypothetical protein BCD49_31505 [Pseudofrankia sp. EUN1h]
MLRSMLEALVRPSWVEQVTTAAQTLVPPDRRDRPRPRPLAQARRVDEGVYAVSTARGPIGVDAMIDLHLAPRGTDASDRMTYRVTAVEEGRSELRVRVAPHAPHTGLWLWGTARAAGYLERNLVECWKNLGDPGLASQIVDGILTPVLATVNQAPGLSSDQARAYHACTTNGVRMVWGPPGTGKTTVLARAIDDLLTRGKRVLLVSATNIAVDNALLGVVLARDPPAGELVRVGPPALARIAQDDRVSLPRLVQARLRTLTGQLAELEQKIRQLEGDPALARLQELDERLDGFELVAHRAAQARVERDRALAARTDQLSAAESRLRAAEGARDELHAAWVRACDELGAISAVSERLAEASRLRAETARLDAHAVAAAGSLRAVGRRLTSLRERRAALPGGTPRAWLRNRAEQARLGAAVAEAERSLAAATWEHDEARRLADEHRALATPLAAEHESAAAPVTAGEVTRRQGAVADARKALRRAQASLDAAYQEVERLRAVRAQILARAGASDRDRAVIEAAERAGLPALADERAVLSKTAASVRDERSALERRYEQVLEALEKSRTETEPAIIRKARLVAATLTRFRIHSAVYDGPYDAVFVDEAAAALLPDLLLAAAKAQETVVLLGDFRQLGPVRPTVDESAPHAPWLLQDCFALVGVTEPATALAMPGCVALRTTRRFGPQLVELANRIAYDGVLVAGRPAPASADDAQIVLVDTDGLDGLGLDELGRVRLPAGQAGRWWLAGSLLARALAEHHRERGESSGIITPYRAQALATVDYLDDVGSLGGDPPVEAGTAHTFQGREFDVAIVDLVEDGGVPGWAARASLRSARPMDREGAKLLNVAITRARHRAYLLVSRRAVAAAYARSTLGAVGQLVRDGTIHVVRAVDLLGLPDPDGKDAPPTDPLVGELWEAFQGHVVVERIYDEAGYVTAVRDAIQDANHSVWIWSPWFGARQDALVPLLARARDRGVTVTAFVVDEKDWVHRRQRASSRHQDRRLGELAGAVSRLVRLRQMHQKIVIVDDETVFVGSYNTLSSTGRREIMIRHRGRRFAAQVLRHERAAQLAEPPSCPKEGAVMDGARSARAQGDGWHWVCPACGTQQQLPRDDNATRRTPRGGAGSSA